jgi:hypothetical protein
MLDPFAPASRARALSYRLLDTSAGSRRIVRRIGLQDHGVPAEGRVDLEVSRDIGLTTAASLPRPPAPLCSEGGNPPRATSAP